jgi:HEAT repeat protein
MSDRYHRSRFRFRGLSWGLLWIVSNGCDLPWTPPPPPTQTEVRMMRQTIEEQAIPQAISADLADTQLAEPDPAPPSGGPIPLRPYSQWTLREVTVDSLSRIGAAAVPELAKLLRDPDPELRLSAVRAMERIGPEAALAVPDLVRLLTDEDPRIARGASRALGQIGPNAAAAVPALILQLQESVDR